MKNLVFNLRTKEAQTGCATSSRMAKLLTTLLFLTLGVGQMWGGPTFSGGYAYFYNKGNWSDSYKQLCIGKDSYTETRPMTAITNTKLWYNALPTSGWGDATYMAVMGNSSNWGSGSWGPSNLSNANHRTGTVSLDNWGFSSGNVNMLTPASGSNDATLTLDYIGNAYSSLNKTITFGAKTSVNGAAYAAASTPGKLTASSYAFSNYTTCGTSKSATLNAGTSGTTTISCGYTATTTLTAADATGYEFVGWYNASGTQVTSSKTLSINPTEATTYYAYYRTFEVKATVSDGGSATPTSWTYMSPSTGGNITATPNTGYSFSGWSILSGGGGYFGATGTETTSSTPNTVFRPTKSSTLKATFTAKNYTVTLDKNGGDSDGSIQTTYNSNTTSSPTFASRAGYSCDGYFTAADGGTKIINADGTLVSGTVAGWLSSGYWVKDAADITLYAHWTESATYYTLHYTYGTGLSARLSSISAAKTSGGDAIADNASLLSGTGVTLSATPADHYKFVGWYSAAGCAANTLVSTDNPYSFSMSDNTNLYAKAELMTTVITLNANGGAGGTSSVTATHGSKDLSSSITKPTRDGYTLSGWYTEESGGTQVILSSGYTKGSVTDYTTSDGTWIYTGSTLTLYAHWTEKKSTITVTTATSSQGTLKFGSTDKSWGTTASLGVATTQSITATAAAGFTFVRWDLSGAAASASTLTNATITLKADGTGSTGTATAVFEEDLSSPWIVAGGNKIVTTGTTWRTTADDNNTMLKKTGHSTESVVYFTVPVTTVCSGDNNENFQFKIYNTSTSTWYSLGADGSSYYLLKDEDGTAKSLVTDGKNIELRAYVTGNYEFKLDYSSTPKLTVTWPVFNQVRISAASPTDATNVGNFDMSDPVSNVRTVTRSLKANTTYTFKIMYNSDWYGYNSGTFTRSTSTSSNSRTISTSGGDMTLTTDYAGDYTFRFNQSTKALSVDFPEAYKVTYDKGTVDGSSSSCSAKDIDNGNAAVTSNSTWVKSGNRVVLTAPEAKTGYTYDGWFDNNSGTGAAITTNANCTITVSSALSRYACYHENLTAITITTDGHGTITTPSPNNSPYSLGVATMQAINASPSTGYHWNTWTVSGNAALNSTATTQSNKAKGNGTSGGTGTVTATFSPNTYYVRFNGNGGTGSMSNQTLTYDAAQILTSNAFTRTGYTFAGWATAADGSVAYTDGQSVSNLSSTQGATVDLYAKWTAKTYTVTLDVDEDHKGTIAGAATSQTVTYDATPTTIANRPTAEEGYGLDSYYTGHNGAGTKLINGDGTWVASVAGYTDASSHWIHDGDETLYAYYKKAEITVGLAAAVVAPWTEESPSTVTATPTLSPSPEGNTKICWFLLQNNNNPVEPQPTFTPGEGNSVSFPAPTVSGNYKVVATLRTGTSCDGGTLLDADTVIFTVAGEHTVTILYKCGDDVIKASTTSPGKPLEGTSITAPDIIGYSFHHWVLGDGVTLASGTAGSAGSAGTATISYTAIYDGQITAVYTKKRLIYFNNTLGWSNVYVYFYKNANYWDNSNGTGSNTSSYSSSYTGIHGQMLPVSEGSQIYYFDAEAAGVNASYQDVAFTELEQTNYNYFAKTGSVKNKVIRRGDYKATTLPMFVPLAGVAAVNKNGNLAEYYNEGYWMNYPENTGYWLKIYSSTALDAPTLQTIPFEFTADKTLPMNLTVELEAGRTYGFEIYRNDGSYYGLSGTTFKIGDSGDEGQTVRAVTTSGRTGLKTSVAGDYIFKLGFGNSGGYNYLVGVHYPVAANDYRIVYNDRVKWSHNTAHSASWHHPSRAIHKEDGAKDTVSFYVSKAAGASASMKFQYARSISSEGVVTWSDVASGSIDLSSIENSGVYNFILTQSAGSISVEKIEPYTGAYYIRTDCAGSTKWDNYRAADHQMTYSEFSKSRETNKFGDLFSHYYTKWCPRGTNIKFCIANDYSSCVSDTLIQDEAFDGSISDFENVDANGTLKNHGEGDATADPYSANIRFMYDEANNRIKRAYVAAATNENKRFLVLQGDDNLKDKNGDAITATANLEANAVLFQDNQNWIYETTVKAIPGARIRIYANYLVGLPEQATQFFCGASEDWDEEHTVELIGGSGSTPMLVRVIYDFKTNRLVCAWMPDGSEIEGDNAINADIMVIREHQDAAQTITFKNDESKLSEVKTVYGAMKFNRWILNNRQHPEDINPDHCRAANIESDLSTYHPVLPPAEQKSIYERSLYFISFPFRVKLSEVFGFGKYWDEWYIEYYDGETRAKNGYWKDSPPNWKYVTTDMLNSFYLEPNVGYILGLDLDYMQAENTTFWANGISNVELYFPSQESIETIGRTAVTMPALGEAYLCTINRGTSEGDRRVKDSYWRCIGVPGYSSYNNTLTVDGSNEFSWQTNTTWREDFKDYPFLYEWNMTDNTLTAQSTNRYNFKAMHAYLVQNGNEIHWSAISATPVSPIVARNRAASQTEYLWRLTMECDGKEEDQAFIRMTDEEAVTDGFDFGQDLVKEYNYQRSDLYTYIGYERAAANSMPLHTEETTSIPVGVSIEKGGEYTFAMPDGTSGVGITLIDSETGAQTNLSAGFTYTVNFEKGDYNNRLYLEISPVSQLSTGVDEVPSDHVQGTKARKVVIDGLLYIVKDGQMYDATGKHCK